MGRVNLFIYRFGRLSVSVIDTSVRHPAQAWVDIRNGVVLARAQERIAVDDANLPTVVRYSEPVIRFTVYAGFVGAVL